MSLTTNLLIIFLISVLILVIGIMKTNKMMMVLSSTMIGFVILVVLFLVFILIPYMWFKL
mgnify:FL=1